MNRLFLIFALLLSSLTFAEQEEKQEKLVQIQEKINNIDPHWIHEILYSNPSIGMSDISFENGLWLRTSKSKLYWNKGDYVVIIYYPRDKYLYVYNITQNQLEGGFEFFFQATPSNSDFFFR